MSGGGDPTGLQSEINVTPMVDIMLVLLIIFMVVTPLLQAGVTVVLPKGNAPDEDANITKDNSVVVSIPFEGAFYLGRDLVRDEATLITKIKSKMEELKPSDPRVVYIKGGNNVQYGEIVRVVNAIRESGVEQLGLVADKRKSGEK
jgi:biopolymer transport protein ExbD/biopolymer transport protein TolR